MKKEKEHILKEIWSAFYSMKFGMILLLIIGVASIAGTIIPQNNPLIYYEREYNAFVYMLISTLSLHRLYQSWWFIAMMLALSLNLILCSIIRFPVLFKRIRRFPALTDEMKRENYLFKREFDKPIDVERLFRKAGFYRIKKENTESGIYYCGKKNNLGYLGSWLSHVGLLIIILSYLIGQLLGFNTYVYGVPGVTEPIEKTDYLLTIDDFEIQFREDHTVNQYISRITLKNEDNIDSGQLSVNHPYRAKDFSIYQNGTGWAVDMTLLKNGEKIAERVLYQNEIHVDDHERIALQFVNFYPDYINTGAMPATISPYSNNPHLLYVLFYEGIRVDMNVVSMNVPIQWEEYSFVVNEPRHFTLLQIVSDPGIGGAKLGGLLLLHGILFSFYFHPKQLKVLKTKDEKTIIWADSTKGQQFYIEKLRKVINTFDIGGAGVES